VVGQTVDTSGNLARSVVEGVSSYHAAFKDLSDTQTRGKYGYTNSVLTPGVRIVCTDLDYTVIGVLATGRTEASDRRQRSS
jgi:hypothetical protein